MTTATRSRIVYIAWCEGWKIGEGNDRDEADEIIYSHANRNRRKITDGYSIEVTLRKEGE